MKIWQRIGLLILTIVGLNGAEARPGGGHASSGHSAPSGGGYSHGGAYNFGSYGSGHSFSGGNVKLGGVPADLPAAYIAIIALILLIYLLRQWDKPKMVVAQATSAYKSQQNNRLQSQLAVFKQHDTNFSTVLLLDFVHSLYSKFYSYSTHPEFSYLSPFLSPSIQTHFQQAGPWTINEIVINGLRIENIGTIMEGDQPTDRLSVRIEANYTLHQQDHATRYTVTERWVLQRQHGQLSPPPDKMQALSCPHCGAPAHFTDAGECQHCGSTISQGANQWYLSQRAVIQTTALATADLVSYAQEQGTALPTLLQEDLAQQQQTFSEAHGLATWQDFWPTFAEDVVKAYFLDIYNHWSQRDWQAVRHLLSDRLYESNAFWMALYAEHDWYNRLNQLNISQVEAVKIECDAFYEAITVRIFAACYDYTEDAQGKLIGGSKRELRRYSEYWTFVRRNGVTPSTAPYSLTQCPQCGAPADKMGQTAECGYCGAKISTGAFSWVLFMISQDEVYEG